jgi:acyl-CoA synthetase (AMP-forming)/AMP-acid ligase II
MPDRPLSRRIADVLELQPDAAAIEYDGQWFTWGQVADLAHRVGSLDVRDRQVGILLRNRPEHVATLIGVLLSGGTVVAINPSRGDDRTRADIDAMRLPLIIGARDDLRTLVTPSGGHDDGVDLGSRRRPSRDRSTRSRRLRRPSRSRGADADQRNDRPAQAN